MYKEDGNRKNYFAIITEVADSSGSYHPIYGLSFAKKQNVGKITKVSPQNTIKLQMEK